VNSVSEYLEYAKASVETAVKQFQLRDRKYLSQITNIELNGKETKLVADKMLDEVLHEQFLRTGLAVFSEESGISSQESNLDLLWVIDPLDGSLNYLRGIGPCAVSVALCSYGKPLFGVMYSLNTATLHWGGKEFGSWSDGEKLRVSLINKKNEALICSGFPARFNAQNTDAMNQFLGVITQFAKVRMLGSAASSLLMVAQGRADAYYEDSIMYWDVAAGLAIVEGAGGMINSNYTNIHLPQQILAANASLTLNDILGSESKNID
jgi:myo-inositol-1(or 4)-monophosphatase